MSVGIKNNIASYLANEEVDAKLLVVIDIGTEVFRFIADETYGSVDIGEQTYISASISIGAREENSDNSLESLDITLSNKWQEWAAIVANKGNTFLGKSCRLYQWFPDYPNELPVEIYNGILDEIKMTPNEFNAVIVRTLGDYDQQAPLMLFQVNCQFVFKSPQCGYSGVDVNCEKSAHDCWKKGNIERFGGFPSVPEEFLINKK